MSVTKPVENTELALLDAQELDKVTRAFQNAVAHALAEYERAGNDVPILQNGKVVWVSPQELLNSEKEKAPPPQVWGAEAEEKAKMDNTAPGFPSHAPQNWGGGASFPIVPASRIFHADLYGTRAAKYATLAAQSINDVPWTEIIPNAPSYLFVPQNQDVRAEYELGWSVKDIFGQNVMGFQTHRDHFAIDFDETALRHRIDALRDTKLSDNEVREQFHVTDNRDWQISSARKALRADNNWEAAFTKCLFRPFDERFCYYSYVAMDYPRKQLLKDVLHKDNICLGVGKQGMAVGEDYWTLVSVSKIPVDANVFRRGGINLFPLYIYPTANEAAMGIEKHANLAPAFVQALQERTQTQATPEQIFRYLYAILHSPTYRTRYGEFLKRDFPRIPLPRDYDHFRKGESVGKVLIGSHLLERNDAINPPIGFPHAGTNTVGKLPAARRYQPGSPDTQTDDSHTHTGRIHLNDMQYWTNIPADVWQFRVGGYQPAAKWLDDRAGRTLSDDDLTHYRKLLIALNQTLLMLPAADEVFARCLAG